VQLTSRLHCQASMLPSGHAADVPRSVLPANTLTDDVVFDSAAHECGRPLSFDPLTIVMLLRPMIS